MSRLGILPSLLAIACTGVPPAQVLVTVDAEPGVRAISNSTLIRIWGRAADAPFDDALFLEETGNHYPWVVALRPQNTDTSRIFRVEATAFTGSTPETGNFVAQARVISGYTPSRVIHIYLLLTDACIGVPCEQLSEACRNGRCEPIPEPTTFNPDGGFPDGGPPACGTPSLEVCDHQDNDCDGRVDDGFDFLSDPTHCGGCENDCEVPNASATCADAACVVECDEGWGDCNDLPADGCEQRLLDRDHCGACGRACMAPTPLCQEGPGGATCVASCTGSTMNCSGACVDTTMDEAHCGGCDMPCDVYDHVVSTCDGGCTYACDADWRDCDGSATDGDGCEVNLTNDILNCGNCFRACLDTGPCTTPQCISSSCDVAYDDNAMCDFDSNPCTDDRCSSGECLLGSNVCGDGGMPPDAGGGSCGPATCTNGICCWNGTSEECCTMGELCDYGSGCVADMFACTGTCLGTGRCCLDGGPPVCCLFGHTCGPGGTCSGTAGCPCGPGSVCCPNADGGTGFQCCPADGNHYCTPGGGGCRVGSGPCGSCPSGVCCDGTSDLCCAGMTYCTASGCQL